MTELLSVQFVLLVHYNVFEGLDEAATWVGLALFAQVRVAVGD